MTVKIRLARFGAKKKPFYRIVAANASSPRDGRNLERLGTYNPLLSSDDSNRVILNKERILYWLDKGAKPTDRVAYFLHHSDIEFTSAKLLNAKKLKEAKKKAEEKANELKDAAAKKIDKKEADQDKS